MNKEVLNGVIDDFKNLYHIEKEKRKEQQQELERYKNIIDELERWLELIALQYKKNDIDDFAIYENILIKLKELKGE